MIWSSAKAGVDGDRADLLRILEAGHLQKAVIQQLHERAVAGLAGAEIAALGVKMRA